VGAECPILALREQTRSIRAPAHVRLVARIRIELTSSQRARIGWTSERPRARSVQSARPRRWAAERSQRSAPALRWPLDRSLGLCAVERRPREDRVLDLARSSSQSRRKLARKGRTGSEAKQRVASSSRDTCQFASATRGNALCLPLRVDSPLLRAQASSRPPRQRPSTPEHLAAPHFEPSCPRLRAR